MDSINTERSYTEYEVTEPTTDFAIGFDNYSGEDKDAIHVTLDGVNLDNLNYTVVRKNAQVIEVTPAIATGVVRIQRETYIDQAFHTFTAGALFSPKSVDENFEQIRHSQQEVNDGFTFLAENTNGVVQASKEATAQAITATVEATASAALAESAADTAVQAVGSLQGVVDAATTATTEANTATATATTAASQATAATTSAQNAALAANTAKQEAAAAATNANAATVDTLAATGRANEAADVVADLVVGKVRTQDVSTSDGSTQDVKNSEFRNELDALPFEGGVLADTFLTVENTINQRQVNRGLSSVLDLQLISAPVNAMRITVKSFYANKGCGGGSFEWQSDRDKAEANGGTIIDPSVFGAYDGTHSTIEDYLLAQGTGVGTGCWVAIKQRVIDATRFGLLASGVDVPSMDRADISAPLQRSIEVAAQAWSNGVVRLPAGYMTLRKKVSHDFGGGVQTSVLIAAQGGHSQIDSKVVGQDSLEFFNASSVTMKNISLYGNKLTDFLGNGHGVSFKSKKIGGSYPQYPNNLEISGLRINGFAGSGSTAGSGEFAMQAAGLFIDMGVANKVYDTIISSCFYGVYLHQTQQTTLRNVTSVGNTFCNIFGYELLDTNTFDSCNAINVIEANRVEVHNYKGVTPHSIQAACIILYQSTGMVNINNVKVKGDATAVRSFNSRSVRLNNCFMRAPITGLPAVVVEGNTETTKLSLHECDFDSSYISPSKITYLQAQYPDDGYDYKARGVLIKGDGAGYRHMLSVVDCDFNIIHKWSYGVRIQHTSATDKTQFTIRDNRVRTHNGVGYDSYLDDFLVFDTGTVQGEFINNNFTAFSSNNQSNGIKNTLTLTNPSATPKPKLVVYGNEYFVYAKAGSTAEIVNKALPDVAEGEVDVTNTTAGNFAFDVSLNAPPTHVALKVLLVNGAIAGSKDVFIQPTLVSSMTAKNVVFRAVNTTDGAPFSGSLRVAYRASTGARAQ